MSGKRKPEKFFSINIYFRNVSCITHNISLITLHQKILVTGGTGFLGAYIIKELISRGFPVRAIKRASSNLPEFIEGDILKKVEWVEGDILDLISLGDAMRDIEIVIHAAAVVSFSAADRAQMYNINVQGTANVVNTALESGVRKLVYISSVAALGRKKDGAVVNENTKWEESRSNTHYAISKYRAELEVWRGFAEGLEGVVLNPATILGYGNWNDGSSAIFKNVYNEFGWYTNGINGFVDVEDVAKATVELTNSDITEERFVICGDNWSFKKLLDTMADGFGKKRPHREATPLLSGLAWRIEKIKSLIKGTRPLVTKESAKVANTETIFDNTKLPKVLKWFRYTPLEETIRKACAQYLNN